MAWKRNPQMNEMYALYEKGYSLAEVGKVYGKTRQSVWGLFNYNGLETRKQRIPLPYLMFNGIKYSLRNHEYYAATSCDRNLMHRDVWIFYNGDIPDNYDIHHIDHDKWNNAIENLELISKSEHARRDSTGNNQFGKWARK